MSSRLPGLGKPAGKASKSLDIADFLDHSLAMGRRNRQNLPSLKHFFALDFPSPTSSEKEFELGEIFSERNGHLRR